MCKKCGAFYCKKCSDTLADIENASWVCESPFDESKPVKVDSQDMKEVGIGEKIQIGKKSDSI